jgi:hypothetical protein
VDVFGTGHGLLRRVGQTVGGFKHLLSKLTYLTSVFSAPNLPQRAFPEGFHGTQIPLDADTVIQLIEHKLDRLDMVRDE